MKTPSEPLTGDLGSVIYATGCTPDGVILIGGVWKLWEQEGFPLEMAHLVCRDKGWLVDWLEAMADASRTNNLPALMKAVEAFLPEGATHGWPINQDSILRPIKRKA